MMKKIVALFLALMLMIPFAVAEDAAEETPEFIPSEHVKIQLSMEGDMIDGFLCVPEIKHNGTENLVVYLDSMHYEKGVTTFSFSALSAGEAIVTLQYMRPSDRFMMQQKVYMIVVTEEGLVEVRDMTEELPLTGTVKEVTEDGMLIETADQGDVLCRLPEGMTPAMEGELIQVWHNGAMTMSLPAQVGVLAWELVTMQPR